jgi:hypothetical protein
MNTIHFRNSSFQYTVHRSEALKLVDESRIFDANVINLERIGFAMFDMSDTETPPKFAQRENRYAIQRGDCVDRVYFNSEKGWWETERMAIVRGQIQWQGHPAIGIAVRMLARCENLSLSGNSALLRSQVATKHVFMALLGTQTPFVIIGKKADIADGIAGGYMKMWNSRKEGENIAS